jgi:hypothetical protein
MSAEINMVGNVLPGVTCIGRGSHRGAFVWRCECGNKFERRGAAVRLAVRRTGRTSCGCLHVNAIAENGRKNRTHGQSVENRKLYDVHRQMLQRCFNIKCKDFSLYGARGITVCDAWRNVSVFVDWAVEAGYRAGLTIDRIDVNGCYCPKNCRWIPNTKQAGNRRNNRLIEVDSISRTVSDWSRHSGTHVQTILGRLNRGWPPVDAVYGR